METTCRTNRFAHGQVVTTPGVRELMNSDRVNVFTLLRRHLAGDWGDLSDADKQLNDRSLEPDREGRLFSSYQIEQDVRVWVITEWDRSVTTLLLPSEY